MSAQVKGQLQGRHVLFILLAFFGVMVAVNTVFTVYAVRTFPGEQVEKSYLQGLDYNSTLDARAAQAALGWRAQMGVADNEYTVILLDDQNRAVTNLTATVTLNRPSHGAEEVRLTLQEQPDGRYTAPLPNLGAGSWEAQLVMMDDGERVFEARKTLLLS